jgi:hypothetical protein
MERSNTESKLLKLLEGTHGRFAPSEYSARDLGSSSYRGGNLKERRGTFVGNLNSEEFERKYLDRRTDLAGGASTVLETEKD